MTNCGTDGWTWTTDLAHSKKLVDELIFGAKAAATPGSKATGVNDPHSEDNLTPEKAERYRSLAGRFLYHSLDDPRVQFDTGLVMRGMSTPSVLDEARLHRAVRYVAGTPGVDWVFRLQGGGETLKLWGLADADHPSDDESRRTVSCSQEFLGCNLLDQEVGRQTCVAGSSRDSEFHALTLCAARLIFTRSLVYGFGIPHVEGPTAYSDSDSLAARGIANRKGGGKLKHLQVRSLWLQQAGRMDR